MAGLMGNTSDETIVMMASKKKVALIVLFCLCCCLWCEHAGTSVRKTPWQLRKSKGPRHLPAITFRINSRNLLGKISADFDISLKFAVAFYDRLNIPTENERQKWVRPYKMPLWSTEVEISAWIRFPEVTFVLNSHPTVELGCIRESGGSVQVLNMSTSTTFSIAHFRQILHF